MIRSIAALLSLSVLTVACATSQQTAEFGRQCPLGNTTEITVTSDQSPQNFALETAAKATIRDGYEKFRVVRGTPKGDTYVMLIRMVPTDETETTPDMIVARDVLSWRSATPTL